MSELEDKIKLENERTLREKERERLTAKAEKRIAKQEARKEKSKSFANSVKNIVEAPKRVFDQIKDHIEQKHEEKIAEQEEKIAEQKAKESFERESMVAYKAYLRHYEEQKEPVVKTENRGENNEIISITTSVKTDNNLFVKTNPVYYVGSEMFVDQSIGNYQGFVPDVSGQLRYVNRDYTCLAYDKFDKFEYSFKGFTMKEGSVQPENCSKETKELWDDVPMPQKYDASLQYVNEQIDKAIVQQNNESEEQ